MQAAPPPQLPQQRQVEYTPDQLRFYSIRTALQILDVGGMLDDNGALELLGYASTLSPRWQQHVLTLFSAALSRRNPDQLMVTRATVKKMVFDSLRQQLAVGAGAAVATAASPW